MRTFTIQVPDSDEYREGALLDISDENGRCCDGLCFDELLGQVVSLCHPELGTPRFAMRTPQEWEEIRTRMKPPIADTDVPF